MTIMNQQKGIENEVFVEGMTCSSCASTVRNYLESEGMYEVFVDVPTQKVTFRSSEDPDLNRVSEGLGKLGYRMRLQEESGTFFTLSRKFWLSAVFTVVLVFGHVMHVLGKGIPALDNPILQLGLALPVYLIGVMHFGRSAWGAVRSGSSNMDVLIFLGSTAAFIYSVIGLVLVDPHYYFFETAASIITLVLLGNLLEDNALRSTTTALGDLEKLRSEKARLWMGQGRHMDIDVQDLRKGDRVIVALGEAFPVDGIVEEGSGEVNEAALTGESLPRMKNLSDPVLAGSVVVSGNFIVRANVDPSETVFNQIIRLVKSAQSEKPPIQRLADRISAWFVPTVIGLSAITFFLGVYVLGVTSSEALMNAIAVLVISCPCAMGLATPTAIIVGMGRLSRQGILVKGSGTLEQLAGIRRVIFDKTGTLTTGQLRVRQIRPRVGMDAAVRQYLYQLELRSSHPVASSLVAYLGNIQLSDEFLLSDIREIPGKGMSGLDPGGTPITLSRDTFDEQQGYHLALERDGEKIAHVVLDDELRPEAPDLVAGLKKRGYHVLLVSGDHEDNVRRVAELTGIEDFHAAQLPQDKYDIIGREAGLNDLAMVGDGINDAPALEKAAVGIAMAGATHVALQSAQVALLKPDLWDLDHLFRISRLTLRTVKENLFWAFSYNIIAIPLAMMGMLNPMWGAIFMAFSDLVVIGNSIRLRSRKA